MFYSPNHSSFRFGSVDKPGHQLETRAPFPSYEDVGWDSSIMGGKEYKGVPVKGETCKVCC